MTEHDPAAMSTPVSDTPDRPVTTAPPRVVLDRPRHCRDDACRQRQACLLYRPAADPAPDPLAAPRPHVAGTWRCGWECHDEPCARGRQALGQSHTPADPTPAPQP